MRCGALRRQVGIQHQAGFALVIVLWVAALLTVIAGSFAYEVRVETMLVRNFLGHAQAGTLAEAGIRLGILSLLSRHASPVGGDVHEASMPEGKVRFSVTAETGKIDLNRAPDALIRGLAASFGNDGDTASLADAILDWRDADDLRRLHGAEDRDYLLAGRQGGARDGPFLTVSELSQVLGMSPDMLGRAHRAATIYSGKAKIDPSVATREALEAVPGLNPAAVDHFLVERDKARSRGQPPPVQLLGGAQSYLAISKSRIYTVSAEGQTTNGVKAQRSAVVRLTGSRAQPYSVLTWFDSRMMEEPPDADDTAGSSWTY